MTQKQIIVLNSGSSSIKFAAFHDDVLLTKTLHGSITGIRSAPVLKITDEFGTVLKKESFSADQDYTFFYELLFAFFKETDIKISAIGHRVVHGGRQYQEPILVTEEIIQNLKKLIPFAPLHQPYNIEAIDIIHQKHPEVPQIACFDTAFHRTHPPVATHFGLPRALTQEGIRRYGFHGLSYEFIINELRQSEHAKSMGKIIVAHLGNGASMCAIKEGESIASTMGFTALDGLVMGTRCGNLDPGVILYLMQFKNMHHPEIEKLLYQQSGLLGVSGISNDMRTLLKDSSLPAIEAVALFVYRIKHELGALCAALGGLDMLVFTGGIGEHAHQIRTAVCEGMEWLGIQIDENSNAQHLDIISTPQSKVEIKVIPTNEEWVIAKHTHHLLKGSMILGE